MEGCECERERASGAARRGLKKEGDRLAMSMRRTTLQAATVSNICTDASASASEPQLISAARALPSSSMTNAQSCHEHLG